MSGIIFDPKGIALAREYQARINETRRAVIFERDPNSLDKPPYTEHYSLWEQGYPVDDPEVAAKTVWFNRVSGNFPELTKRERALYELHLQARRDYDAARFEYNPDGTRKEFAGRRIDHFYTVIATSYLLEKVDPWYTRFLCPGTDRTTFQPGYKIGAARHLGLDDGAFLGLSYAQWGEFYSAWKENEGLEHIPYADR